MQKDKKKKHKKIIKDMRRFNKQLATDEYIGLNRFRIDLFSEEIDRYSDGSGMYMYLIFKLTDKLTDNTAYFSASNYNYLYKMSEYANDFLIRCSIGHLGSFPPLHYIAYDVHTIIPYVGRKDNPIQKEKYKDGVINTYNWTNCNLFKKEK